MPDRDAILACITNHLAGIVGKDDLALTEASNADDVAEWDSTSHVRLLIALERDLNIAFAPCEAGVPDTVGDMIDLIQRKRT